MGSRELLIGIDAGTSLIKAVAFDLTGRQVATASCKNTSIPLPDGGVEQDMGWTWRDTAAVIADLGTRIDRLSDRVIGLGVTGQGDGTWLIDGAGRPVHDGWLWLDSRAARDAERLQKSDVIYQRTGTGVNTCQMRSQLAWMMREAPYLLECAETAFHCKDWLYFKLTGVRATDPTEGVFTFGDYRTRDYSDAVLDALGQTGLRRLLPPILDGSRDTHPLTSEAAKLTGLPAGLPVSLGYLDIACTALGGGLVDPRAEAGVSILGSTGAHMRYVPDAHRVTLNKDRSGYTLALPGQAYAQLQTNMAATLNLDWILGLAAQILTRAGVDRSPDDLLQDLDAQVMGARPGAALFHPYISAAGERGPFTNASARASLTGLDLRTGWDDILRSVCDGLVLAARDCYSAMGPMPREIRLSGGAARSAALRRLLASALGVPVRTVAQPEAGAAGAVMIAGLALGIFPDAESATREWVHPLLELPAEPEPDLTATFDALYDAYLSTRSALPPVWAAQARMQERLK
ncbi:FGGY family carbohydrate kinase [Arenibacterium sp. CAU 1754]